MNPAIHIVIIISAIALVGTAAIALNYGISLEISDNSVKCQKCNVAVPIVATIRTHINS